RTRRAVAGVLSQHGRAAARREEHVHQVARPQRRLRRRLEIRARRHVHRNARMRGYQPMIVRTAAASGAAFLLLAVTAAAAPSPDQRPQRFTVQADGHPLAVWARIPMMPRRAVLLIHGRTWSARPAFDL